jgi:hypothetical protein
VLDLLSFGANFEEVLEDYPYLRTRRHPRLDRIRSAAERPRSLAFRVKFLIDNQLPPALAEIIVNELESDAVHAADIGLSNAIDKAIWEHARAQSLQYR